MVRVPGTSPSGRRYERVAERMRMKSARSVHVPQRVKLPTHVPICCGCRPEAVAMSRIEAQSLAVGAIATVPDASAPVGTVVDQEPAPGSLASRGDSVDLTVAGGPPRHVSALPNAPLEAPPDLAAFNRT